jgi:uncharacterized membrane protein YozB (DUF420 family)
MVDMDAVVPPIEVEHLPAEEGWESSKGSHSTRAVAWMRRSIESLLSLSTASAIVHPSSPQDPAQPKDAVAAAWQRGKKAYHLAMVVLAIAVIVAFLPAVVAWLFTGTWFMNVMLQDTSNPFQRLVSAHAVSALIMLGLLIAQVTTGATGKPGDDRRVYHRLIGRFVLAPLIVFCLCLSAASEVMANLCCQEFSFMTMLTTAIIFVTLWLGLRAAKRKRYAEHKDWMLWTILNISATGTTRIGMYVVQPFMECDSFLSDWPFFLSALLSIIVAYVCLSSTGRLTRKHKSNLFMFTIIVVVGCYALASSLMFECPADRILNATL